MKKILISGICLLFIISCAGNGPRITYDEDGNKTEYNLENGKREGLQRIWWKNGQLKEETFWVNDEIHGVGKMWYDNGQLQIETNMVYGKFHGLVKKYYRNGNTEEIHKYYFGTPVLVKFYFINGQLNKVRDYDAKGNRILFGKNHKHVNYDGVIMSEFTNGDLVIKSNIGFERAPSDKMISSLNSADSIEDVEDVVHFPDGSVQYKATYNNWNKKGEAVLYWENGNIHDIYNYEDGIREGKCEIYYESGKLKIEGLYKNNKRDGIWITYSEDEQIQAQTTYKDGEEVKE